MSTVSKEDLLDLLLDFNLEVMYKDGNEDGLHTGWYKNGKKKYEETYKNDKSISSNCWDESGNECECSENIWEGCK